MLTHKMLLVPALLLGAELYSVVPLSAPKNAGLAPASGERHISTENSEDGKAGTNTVNLDSSKGAARVTVKVKDTISCANDLEFKLVGGSGKLKPEDTKVLDGSGANQLWKDPVVVPGSSGKKWKMEKGAAGTCIPAGGGVLRLKSKNNKGWTQVVYSLTQDGETIYPPSNDAISGDPGDVFMTTFQTGNGFPVSLGTVTHFENAGPGSIAELQMSVTTPQQFVDMGSDWPGYVTFGDHMVIYTFEPPVDAGQVVPIRWAYDEFGPDLNTDVEQQFFITDLVFGLAGGGGGGAVAQQAAAKKAGKRLLSGNIVTVPKFYVRETKIGGLKTALQLSSEGAFKFLTASASVKIVKGSAQTGRVSISANGHTLWIGTGRTGKDLCVVEVSGLKIDISKTPPGLVRLYVKSRKTKVGKVLGRKR